MKTFHISNVLEAGLDEAGRGPLFGRVYVGACIWPPSIETDLIKDSKKLSARKRLIVCDYIKENAIDWSVTWKSAKKIDEINILQATQSAMHDAISNLLVRPDFLLIDGHYFRSYVDKCGKSIPHICIEKGDNEYTSIAAASILAKVHHDKYIEEVVSIIKSKNMTIKAPYLTTGDVLFWNSWTIHGSLDSQSKTHSRSSITIHAIPESHKFLQFHSRKIDVPTDDLGCSLIYRPKDQIKFKNRLILATESYFPNIFYWIKKQAIKSLVKSKTK